MFGWVKKTFWHMVAWFRPEQVTTPQVPPHAGAEKLSRDTEVSEIPPQHVVPPPPDMEPSPAAWPTIDVFPRAPRGKWVKPKGLEKLQKKPRDPSEPVKPKTPRSPKPKPQMRSDDNPEKWGQYYFRDAILDQLDVYFVYLHRMRRADKDAYNLHRQLGIQIMPQNAVENFDRWRSEGELDELSAWWRATRPSFGAIAYGIDKGGEAVNSMRVIDIPPEQWEAMGRDPDGETRNNDKDLSKHRIATITGSKTIDLPDGASVKSGIVWVPKFLYFSKYKLPPATVEKVSDGDVYALTIYWDRVKGNSNTFHKRNKGGFPQEYAVCVERDTKKIRVLRTMVDEPLRIRSRRSLQSFYIPNKRWGFGDAFLRATSGHCDCSPEDFVRRCFIEAALMYETAAMGSMIRVEATKGNLTATFGVEIKRTSYFFKDRDVTLTPTGSREPIFHIVRPHTRKTKTGDKSVKMHFRGLKQFTWAGYRINITVPGRDHRNMAELGFGFVDEKVKLKDGTSSMKELGEFLLGQIRKGAGAWKPNAAQQ